MPQDPTRIPIRSISLDAAVLYKTRNLLATVGNGTLRSLSSTTGNVNRDIHHLDEEWAFEMKPIHVFAAWGWSFKQTGEDFKKNWADLKGWFKDKLSLKEQVRIEQEVEKEFAPLKEEIQQDKAKENVEVNEARDSDINEAKELKKRAEFLEKVAQDSATDAETVKPLRKLATELVKQRQARSQRLKGMSNVDDAKQCLQNELDSLERTWNSRKHEIHDEEIRRLVDDQFVERQRTTVSKLRELQQEANEIHWLLGVLFDVSPLGLKATIAEAKLRSVEGDPDAMKGVATDILAGVGAAGVFGVGAKFVGKTVGKIFSKTYERTKSWLGRGGKSSKTAQFRSRDENIAKNFAIKLERAHEIDPLHGTRYTEKVQTQMRLNQKTALPDNHAFPLIVDNMAKYGEISKIIGGDGLVRTKIELAGEYNGKSGVFEWIIETSGLINHRLFKPNN